MNSEINWVLGLPIAALIIILAITFHELGHFLAAKFTRVGVKEFSIGFPPPFVEFNLVVTSSINGTKRKFSIPVSFPPRLFRKRIRKTLFTVNAIPIGGFCSLAEEDEDASFDKASKKARALILVSGVSGNFLAAILAFALALYMKEGLNIITSLFGGVLLTAITTALTVQYLLAALFTVNFGEFSSIVGATQITADAATQASVSGAWAVIPMLFGLINVSLGVFNLLPIPGLDGGHLMFLLIEAVRGKRNKKFEAVASTLGILILLGFSIFMIFKDIFIGVPRINFGPNP